MKKLGFYFKFDEKTKVLTQHMAVDDRMIGEWPDLLKESDFNKRHLKAENDPEVDKYLASDDKGKSAQKTSPPTNDSTASASPKKKKKAAKK